MTEGLSPGQVRLEIDGRDCAGEWDRVDIATPRLLYEVDTGERCLRRYLGPQGFQVTVTNPSDRLWALVDGGVAVHDVKVTVDGLSLSNPTQFHHAWTDGGVRKMFGCLASNRDNEAKWVTEPQGDQQQLVDAKQRG